LFVDGKLSDIFGRKSTLVAIICFFLVGSWLCGIAGNMVQMGIARAIAGLGGGGIMTMASVVIHDLVPMRKRGKYQSFVNMSQTVKYSNFNFLMSYSLFDRLVPLSVLL
jgi:MFS family permease